MIGGALSPDGSRIVAAVESGGHTNLFLLERSGEEIRQLTEGHAINVNPAFSADGQQLAFTSDRSGTPQIYVMSLGGGAARRVTFQGDYNTSPSFSPDGKWLAYQSRSGGFNIFIIPVAGGQPVQLTQDERLEPVAVLVTRRALPDFQLDPRRSRTALPDAGQYAIANRQSYFCLDGG